MSLGWKTPQWQCNNNIREHCSRDDAFFWRLDSFIRIILYVVVAMLLEEALRSGQSASLIRSDSFGEYTVSCDSKYCKVVCTRMWTPLEM